ncbi:sn-glycerol-3-phosphate transport system permease protein ugpA [uncultured Ruminococcus sp.]|uniref:carbohydrate ABC transporter permease n=1 Tax=Massiliimalia timonensis TaxID=1987501 RepID=UPI000821F830|nr:sugar ABC transporter permease [Massiliimalia timonensis]MBS7174906.1 sugar ABC transporter permease [Clostridiales bacterium]SCH95234.1 sn-glycerol-3-phosphate transport system permease protein ugpA [uncultured Clostridium sp.]SCI28173.1 sn-glycerol-3-phosphate transport system permease protein ugpA [uncultured Ruminococcus sp.]
MSEIALPLEQISVRRPSVVKTVLKRATPFLFLAPALLLVLFWVYRPLVETFALSTKQWNMNPNVEPINVGLDNFRYIFTHPDFLQAVLNTAIYILAMLPFSVIIPMILAIVTNNLSNRAKNIYRALFFLPMIMPPVAISAVWRWLMHPVNGLINSILIKMGLIEEGIRFLSDENMVLFSIVIIAGWKMIGFSTLMFSAGLTGIDKSYYEAASVDGHRRWKQTLSITIPLLSPTIMLMIMMSVLMTAQWTFAYIDVLTQGGPAGASTNVYYLLWTYGFKNFNSGLSAAAAVVFFIGFGLLALLFTRLTRKIAFYDN